MKLGDVLEKAGVVKKEDIERIHAKEKAAAKDKKEQQHVRELQREANVRNRNKPLRDLLPAFVGWHGNWPKDYTTTCSVCGKKGTDAAALKMKLPGTGLASILRGDASDEDRKAVGDFIKGVTDALPEELARRAMLFSGASVEDGPHPNDMLEPIRSYMDLDGFLKLLEFVPRHQHEKCRGLVVCRECIAKSNPGFALIHERSLAMYETVKDPDKFKRYVENFLGRLTTELSESGLPVNTDEPPVGN